MMLTSVLSDMSGMNDMGVNVGEAVPNTSTVETSGREAPGVTSEVSDAEDVDIVDVVAAICCGA